MEASVAWTAPEIDLRTLDKDAAKLLFELAEKRLKHILDVSDRTTNRAIGILTASIPLMGFLLSLLFKHYYGLHADRLPTTLLFLTWTSLGITLLSVVLLAVVAFPRLMHQMGREPKHIFISDFVANEHFTREEQYKVLLVAEIEELQQRITYMQAQSDQRIKCLKIGFLTLALWSGICFTSLVWLVGFPW